MKRDGLDSVFDAPSATAPAVIAPASTRKTRTVRLDQTHRQELLPLPRWTQCADETSPSAAAFASGAALHALDTIVKGDPRWLGTFRLRQGLIAATASARLLGHRQGEDDLRDAHHLPSEAPGPAGVLHRAWRTHASRPARADHATCQRLSEALGLHQLPAFGFPELAGDPIAAASKIARLVTEAYGGREGEVLGLMLADQVLAIHLGWTVPIPLLATAISFVRAGPEGRRAQPGNPDWLLACHIGFARAASDAHARALDLARRADRLLRVADTVRTRHRQAAVAALLDDDAVAATALTKRFGSERAARRFLLRLADLGAIRELTGRQTFRLYGL